MNASIAIQVLPKVATNEETVRIVDEVIVYIYPIGMLLTTTYLITLIIVYAETILSLTNIDVIVITDTYILSVYRVDSTYFE